MRIVFITSRQKLISRRCMRRLQSNLAYLAAIADRSHKPSSQIPPHPAIMSAPPLAPKPSVTSPSGEKKEDPSEEKKSEENEDRIETLKDQYKRLQTLFPGVDPKKEPPIQSANAAARAQAQAQMQAKQNQVQSQGTDQIQAQKLQNDLLRQKMMQQQAAQMQQQGMQMNQQMMQNR